MIQNSQVQKFAEQDIQIENRDEVANQIFFTNRKECNDLFESLKSSFLILVYWLQIRIENSCFQISNTAIYKLNYI